MPYFRRLNAPYEIILKNCLSFKIPGFLSISWKVSKKNSYGRVFQPKTYFQIFVKNQQNWKLKNKNDIWWNLNLNLYVMKFHPSFLSSPSMTNQIISHSVSENVKYNLKMVPNFKSKEIKILKISENSIFYFKFFNSKRKSSVKKNHNFKIKWATE